MYELVISQGSKEFVVFSSEDRRLVELKKEEHIRSGAPGFATVREKGK